MKGFQGECCDSDQFRDNGENTTDLKVVRTTGLKRSREFLFLILFTAQSIMVHCDFNEQNIVVFM